MFEDLWIRNDENDFYVKEFVCEYDDDILYHYKKDLTSRERIEDELLDLICWLEIRRHDMNKQCDSCLDYVFDKFTTF